MSHGLEHRVLIHVSRVRDAELTQQILARTDLACRVCETVDDLCARMREGAGAVITTEEAIEGEAFGRLSHELERQPAWSELPLLVFTGSPESSNRAYERLKGCRCHLTLLDRPIHIGTLISVTTSALKSRERQYEIRDLMATLEARVHERDRFLAILGHELRNPLAAILLASQMIDPRTRKLDEEYARTIERQSRHLNQLVNDLLDLSRVASGKIVLKEKIIDLREVARLCLETVQNASGASALHVELHVADDPVLIKGDPVRIDQILGNLLTNAFKYTPPGGHVTVTIGAGETSALIEVRDDGVGISPERIGTIFELFTQADNAIGRSQGGMGIGLALVKNLVELHGGDVSARSGGIGKGSVFTIELPLAVERELVDDRRASSRPAPSGDDRPRRIVLIEDNRDVRDLLQLKLTRLGHEVDAVEDGQAGFHIVVERRPEVALIDIGLPGIDGYEVARRVRERLGDEVFLVALSGFGQPEDKRRATESGFDAHLTKPAEMTDIEHLLAQFPRRTS